LTGASPIFYGAILFFLPLDSEISPVASCRHKKLALIQPSKEKVRCTNCHLVIAKEELVHGYCPECHEVRGVSHYEFEEVKEEQEAKVRYRCEDCGAIIEWDGPGTDQG
jgi:predicted RNA-binding Zn-ribbon protein involved in translation (DUF1610 family)